MFILIINLILSDFANSASVIFENSGAAKVDVTNFGYAVNPQICGVFNDCFNCTLSHCVWDELSGQCSNAKQHADAIAVDEFMGNERTDMNAKGN